MSKRKENKKQQESARIEQEWKDKIRGAIRDMLGELNGSLPEEVEFYQNRLQDEGYFANQYILGNSYGTEQQKNCEIVANLPPKLVRIFQGCGFIKEKDRTAYLPQDELDDEKQRFSIFKVDYPLTTDKGSTRRVHSLVLLNFHGSDSKYYYMQSEGDEYKKYVPFPQTAEERISWLKNTYDNIMEIKKKMVERETEFQDVLKKFVKKIVGMIRPEEGSELGALFDKKELAEILNEVVYRYEPQKRAVPIKDISVDTGLRKSVVKEIGERLMRFRINSYSAEAAKTGDTYRHELRSDVGDEEILIPVAQELGLHYELQSNGKVHFSSEPINKSVKPGSKKTEEPATPQPPPVEGWRYMVVGGVLGLAAGAILFTGPCRSEAKEKPGTRAEEIEVPKDPQKEFESPGGYFGR